MMHARIALFLLAIPAIAHAEPWSALMPGIALNPAPAPVDDPGGRCAERAADRDAYRRGAASLDA